MRVGPPAHVGRSRQTGHMTDVRPGYTLVDSPPSVADYLALRRDSGMHPKTEEQAEAGIHGAWAAVHVRHEELSLIHI